MRTHVSRRSLMKGAAAAGAALTAAEVGALLPLSPATAAETPDARRRGLLLLGQRPARQPGDAASPRRGAGGMTTPDLEIVLILVQAGPLMDETRAEQLRELIRQGTLGAGVLETADCRRAYEELKAKGVQFTREPTEQFYGIEALMKDDSGNWFSLTERKH